MTDSTQYIKRFTADDQQALRELARTIRGHLSEIETQVHILNGFLLGISARGQTVNEFMESEDKIAAALAGDVWAVWLRLEKFVAAIEAQP